MQEKLFKDLEEMSERNAPLQTTSIRCLKLLIM